MLRRSLVVAVLVLGLAVGCGDDPPSLGGPLQRELDAGTICAPLAETITFGIDMLRNSGDERVIVTNAKVLGSRDLRVRGVLLAPVVGGSLIGVHASYPPTDLHSEALGAWQARVDAVGATIEPGGEYSIVIGLEPAGDMGGLDAIEVTYDAEGTAYRYRTSTSLELRRTCD